MPFSPYCSPSASSRFRRDSPPAVVIARAKEAFRRPKGRAEIVQLRFGVAIQSAFRTIRICEVKLIRYLGEVKASLGLARG
jgi:hypothetical protein